MRLIMFKQRSKMSLLRFALSFPVALVLAPIIAHDYRLRAAGLRPDRWHWADALIVRLGWAVTPF